MRERINVSVSPVCYAELQRIRKDYGFANLCEICSALLIAFIDRVHKAEQSKVPSTESNEEMIKRMFDDFENWEPTPSPEMKCRRHLKRDPDKVYKNSTRATTNTRAAADTVAEDPPLICRGESVYDLEYLERTSNQGDDDQYDD